MVDDAVHIPLRARDGSIRAYAIVDAADAEWVNRWRWSFDGRYATRRIQTPDGHCRMLRLHRELLGLAYGDPMEGDHKDRDRLNCRRSNLRILPKGKNQQNQSGHLSSTSRFRGVHWNRHQRKWHARITVNRRLRHLGFFDDEIEAANAARNARLALMPYTIEDRAVAS